jgi:hypothetical protein
MWNMTMNRLLAVLTITLLFLVLTACDEQPTALPVPTSTSAAVPQLTSTPTVSSSATSPPPADTPTTLPTSAVTLAPPTATPTRVPPSPTPVPTTATATPRPPLPASTPAPAAERIRIPSGATQTTVEGYLSANESKLYVLWIAAGQFVEMSAAVGTMGEGLRFSIVGADGAVVKPMGHAHVRTVVPSSQDYYVELVSDVGANYNMSVLIPVRVRFPPGGTSADVAGSLNANGVRYYVLHASAGQRMIVAPHVTSGHVRMIIWGADGQVFLSGRVGPPDSTFDGVLPTTQDYLIAVRPDGETRVQYTLDITIPPL